MIERTVRYNTSFFLFQLLISIFIATSCNQTTKVIQKSFGINPNDVASIELIQVKHPYLGGIVNTIKLDSLLIPNFLKDFSDKKAEICKFYSCFVIKIHLKNNQRIIYRTNGHDLEKFNDSNALATYYKLNIEENIITKYWGIPEEQMCKDSVEMESTSILKIELEIEQKIYELIFNLPEVKELSKIIEKKSNGTRHMSVMIRETPQENDGKYYWVQVGINNEFRFETSYNFCVFPTNFSIQYYDTASDTILTLDAWRKKEVQQNNIH